MWTCAGIAAGQAILFVAKPYRDADAQWLRSFARLLAAQVRPGDQVVTPGPPQHGGPLLWWNLQTRGIDVRWEFQIDEAKRARTGGALWIMDFRLGVFAESRRGVRNAILDRRPDWTEHPLRSFELRDAPRCALTDIRIDMQLATPPGHPRPPPDWGSGPQL